MFFAIAQGTPALGKEKTSFLLLFARLSVTLQAQTRETVISLKKTDKHAS